MSKQSVAIIGSGNIGTDLMMKLLASSSQLELLVMVGIDAASDGLAKARNKGIKTTHEGLPGLMAMPEFKNIALLFDATSAAAHIIHARLLADSGKQLVDLTPAALGPFVVPVVNLDAQLNATNFNMVTCGGQATIPIVTAIQQATTRVVYAEIVASISSRSAGPGTRANIDEFTETTARAIETVGGAEHGKAIIVLNPAEPPMIMRDTVFTLSQGGSRERISESIIQMVEKVQAYVPGYRLKQAVQFEDITVENAILIPGSKSKIREHGLKTSVFLEVTGAADYLPAYAGNLDIMTSAAKAAAEHWAQATFNKEPV